jgi:phosphoglycerate dehydrogenase-like enzyme
MYSRFAVEELDNPDQLISSDAVAVFAPLGYKADENFLSKCTRVQVVLSNTTSDVHIDVDYCEMRGIEVCTLKDDQEFLNSITPTSEHAMGLILAVSRNTLTSFRSVTSGSWERWPFAAPQMLSKSRVGIIGLGRLGTQVAGACKSFGAEVVFCDPLNGIESSCFKRVSQSELLATSDIVSIHAFPSEYPLRLGKKEFAQMKQTAVLVNTARGEYVDTEALCDAIGDGSIGGAGLDVLEGEFDPAFDLRSRHPRLFEMLEKNEHNLLLTPHIGGSTLDAWLATRIRVMSQCLQFLI